VAIKGLKDVIETTPLEKNFFEKVYDCRLRGESFRVFIKEEKNKYKMKEICKKYL